MNQDFLRNVDSVNVEVSTTHSVKGYVLNVRKSRSIEAFDEPTYAKLKNLDVENFTLEVEMCSKFLSDAPDFARGFIGIAFRINDTDTKFESVYLRPDNGKSVDSFRRAHAVQYFGYPDYKFDVLRESEPKVYESGSDIEMDAWIHFKLVVIDTTVRLFVDYSETPVLIVNNTKYESRRGSIGLWCDVGTDAYFKNLKIIEH